MARMHPSSPPVGIPDSERQVWHALTQLDDSWLVFHGVEWQGDREGRPAEGEGDFVLLHPSKGLLFLEVKGGRELKIEGGNWKRIHRDGAVQPIADPFEQARSTEHRVVDHIHTELGIRGFRFGHAVVLPHLHSADGLGLAANEGTLIVKSALGEMAKKITEVAAHWSLKSQLSDGDVEAIRVLLSPSTTLRAKLNDDLVLVRERIEAWTQEQVEVLDGLEKNKRVLIYGGAGTGKTILAMEKARRLAREGQSVLLVCFNTPLGLFLSNELADEHRIRVDYFHGLTRKLAEAAAARAATSTDLARYGYPANPPDDWFDEGASNLLVEAANAIGFQIDAVVVDEGQDFSASHWTALELLLKDSDTANFYVFLDRNQALYRDDWVAPFDAASYLLSRNCRNTRPIAGLVASVFGDKPVSLGVDGPDPVHLTAVNGEGVAKALRRLLDETVNKGGVSPSDIVILSSRRSVVDSLSGLTVAGIKLSRNPPDGGVRVESVHRFKGLEADVVFLALLESATNDGESHKLSGAQLKTAYVGMSRARSLLYVLAPEEVALALGLR